MSILKVNSIEAASPGSEDYFLARSWVNFNGSGTVAIRSDGNVSSLSDRGVGQYAVNFSSSAPSVNFTTVSDKADTYQGAPIPYSHACSTPYTTSAAWVETGNELSGGLQRVDKPFVSVVSMY